LVFDGVGLEEGHSKANPVDNNGGQCNTGQETACRVNIPTKFFLMEIVENFDFGLKKC
jgi:hypothetical protein